MNYEKILQGILDIGEEMIVCGAEVSRVEDSIRRMCMAYGANKDRINVFIITSNIQVTIAAPDGHIITQIRQIIRYDVNFDRLDYLNDLSRYVCEHTPDHIRIQELLRKVMDRPTPGRAMKLLGSVLVAAACPLPDSAPNFFECKYCPQYMVSCHPEVMKYEFSR